MISFKKVMTTTFEIMQYFNYELYNEAHHLYQLSKEKIILIKGTIGKNSLEDKKVNSKFYNDVILLEVLKFTNINYE